MRNVQPIVVNALEKILPTYFENFLNPSTEIPCISWNILSNDEIKYGNTVGVSRQTFMIKIWSTRFEELVRYGEQIDDAMGSLGDKIGRFTRINSDILTDGELLCQTLEYQVLVYENYTNYRL